MERLMHAFHVPSHACTPACCMPRVSPPTLHPAPAPCTLHRVLQLRSRFALAPAGNGLHSSRLMEAVFLGAIPVVAEPNLLLPFCDVVDWSAFSVRVAPERWREIPAILRAISPAELARMQAALAAARVAYFEAPMRTAVSLVVFRMQTLANEELAEIAP